MSEELKVEFRVAVGRRKAAAKPEPGAKIARQRQDRATRKARNLALAYWIDELVRSGRVADLKSISNMCGVSTALISNVSNMLGVSIPTQNAILTA